jgi:NAD(P)-dependent dehydrogenase (short-subunit alcohol dehydrogenase family)
VHGSTEVIRGEQVHPPVADDRRCGERVQHPLPERAAYHATKHGVIGLTRSAALEYAPRGIRINAICPGTIATPMVTDMIAKGELDLDLARANQPINLLGTPEEVAASVLWLTSPGAGFVTGVALPVDGGYTAQ